MLWNSTPPADRILRVADVGGARKKYNSIQFVRGKLFFWHVPDGGACQKKCKVWERERDKIQRERERESDDRKEESPVRRDKGEEERGEERWEE
jgi:hypothetical protein